MVTPSRNVDTQGDEPFTDRRYLLHLRRSHGTIRSVTVRDVADGRVHAFAGLADLLRFLEAHGTDDRSGSEGQKPDAQDTRAEERS